MSSALVWLRRDLRLFDHEALSAATHDHDHVFVVVCLSPHYFTGSHASHKRNTFFLRAIQDLRSQLQSHGKDLILIEGEATDVIPALAATLAVSDLYWTRDYTPQAIKRDQAVRAACQSTTINAHISQDQLLVQPKDLLKSNSTPYQIFTPFFKRWMEIITTFNLQEYLVQIDHIATPPLEQTKVTDKLLSAYCSTYATEDTSSFITPPTSAAAHEHLNDFLSHALATYDTSRDFPAKKGTSRISPYVRFGMLSIRGIIRSLLEQTHQSGVSTLAGGAAIWLKELCWREFYCHIMAHVPNSLEHNFHPEFDAISWENNPTLFDAWKKGTTGYPIVDAALRELVSTGWMHNRTRMIVASFLCKDLLIDWKKGEAFFAQHLLDYEPASNVGGWQWAAGTGTDAQPYFRIFNPHTQKDTFDPHADYIKKWIPEFGTNAYPLPIVDHAAQRTRALAMYAAAKHSSM